jgi:type II secretory pathway pseudopilin PulG
VSSAVRHRLRITRRDGQRGFSLIELLIIGGLVIVVSAIGFPVLSGVRERMRLSQGMREVEREIHQARQRAVTNNRAMRVRFNCPSAGMYRAVELIGNVSAPAAADNAADRCNPVTYPFPPADRDMATRPNLDGPVRQLDPALQFGAVQTIEFWPDGSAHVNTNTTPWGLLPVTGSAWTMTHTTYGLGGTPSTRTATLMVNGIGKIQIQPQQ